MKIPSLKNLFSKAIQTFLRFPLPIIFAATAAVIGIYLAGLGYPEHKYQDKFYELIITFCLAGFSCIGLKVYAERKQIGKVLNYVLHAVVLSLIVLFYLLSPDKINLVFITRFILFTIGIHAFISYAPFIGKSETNGFWQYNKMLFLQFATSALYSAVLYIGLSLALLAIDNLFNVKIDSKNYLKLWIFIVGIFNTWFFLSGFPKNYNELENDNSYPLGLKVFSQYILLSLVSVYLVILYVYSAKILFQWHLPEGWVAYLITGFAVLGILSLLLLYPIRLKAENKFINIYTKWFYIILLPLIFLLFIAIFRRISDYGITENRYFVLITAIWLAGISIYLIINKVSNIKIIPVTLCFVVFAISFGPWGAFSVSLNNQLHRFEKILKEEKILVNGKIVKLKTVLPFKTRQQLSTTIEYITEYRSYKIFQPYFTQNLDSLFPDSAWKQKPLELMLLMGQQYVSKWQREDMAQDYFYYGSNRQNEKVGYNISGFQYVLPVNEYYNIQDTAKDSVFVSQYKISDLAFNVEYATSTGIMKIRNSDTVTVSFNLQNFTLEMQKKYASNEYNIKSENLILHSNENAAEAMMVIGNISGDFTNYNQANIRNIQSEIYFRYKP